jgi:cell division initiation protein
MKINTIDIVHKSFSKSFMGYNQEEVNGFLQMIASQLEELVSERNSLKETLRDKELRLAEYREKDQLLQSTITTAGQMAEKIRQDAEREARLIVSEAEQKADNIVREARESLKKIYADISELKRVRLQFESNLKALVHAHLSILEQSDKYLPNIPVGPTNSSTLRNSMIGDGHSAMESSKESSKESSNHPITPVSGLGRGVEFEQDPSTTSTHSANATKRSSKISPLSVG